MSASAQCPHSVCEAAVKVARMEDTNISYAEVTGRCSLCGAPFTFRGMPFGVSPHHPTMAIDGSEAVLPLMFGDEEYDGNATGFVGSRTA